MKKFLKGIIIGISNVIPGLCSATVALMLGIYDELLGSILDLLRIKKWKQNFGFYLGILLGVVIGVIGLSKLYALNPFLSNLIFLGFVIRCYPLRIKDIKPRLNLLWFLLGLLIVIISTMPKYLINSNPDVTNLNYLILMISGFVSSLALIMPGISGALLLVIFGVYFPLLDLIKTIIVDLITKRMVAFSNVIPLIIFGIFFLIGLLFGSFIIKRALDKNPAEFNTLINGMILGTIINLILELPSFNPTIINVILSLSIMVIIVFIKFKRSQIN